MIEVPGVSFEVVPDYDAMSDRAASITMSQIRSNPSSTLLVPTGSTPIGYYGILSAEPSRQFSNTTLYNYDEYCEDSGQGMVPLNRDDPRSYRFFMDEHLLGAQPKIRSFFPGIENEPRPGAYDQLIARRGGIDLCIGAIGADHTFGFNFTGSPFDSVTRLVKVSDDTASANEAITGHKTPTHALTTGMATGMASRKIVVLVSGERKAPYVRDAFHADISPAIPSTIYRQHPNCHWIIDEAAASKL